MIVEISSSKIEIDEKRIEETEKEIKNQLKHYLENEREYFDLKYSLPDKKFTRTVLEEISSIPYGKTKTYGEIARKIDSAAIAVGQACGNNPLPIIIPCHRVVSKNSTGGYLRENNSSVKKKLLEIEGANI